MEHNPYTMQIDLKLALRTLQQIAQKQSPSPEITPDIIAQTALDVMTFRLDADEELVNKTIERMWAEHNKAAQ